jgi:hypothetical protein
MDVGLIDVSLQKPARPNSYHGLMNSQSFHSVAIEYTKSRDFRPIPASLGELAECTTAWLAILIK